MPTAIIIEYFHYLSFMLCFAALAIEAFTLKVELNLKDAWKIVIADAVYGIAAITVLVTGILRIIYFGQGTSYYLHNPFFYVKVAIFLLVGLVSIYPTVSFLNWLKDLQKNQPPQLELGKVKLLQWLIKAEL
ncbi:MAG: DUF2214 family protein, partial [Sphaerospermopsis sp. SIO1G2]|nr:DUF2214 family protein [Sphaerospermopsis sp. SIO1G2]